MIMKNIQHVSSNLETHYRLSQSSCTGGWTQWPTNDNWMDCISVERCYKDLENIGKPLECDHFKDFFGKDPYKISKPIEYFELMNLVFDKKDVQKLAKVFLDILIKEPVDEVL